MFGLGFQEVLILLLIALLLFGAKRLPEAGKALGRSVNEFKKAFQGEEKETGGGSEDGKKKQ
ncbi:MAG: twin-arginine translocase TatA/TatE family subunit [Endomicrobiales bacterium]